MSLHLVIFDVDGTLVDSQGDITACMSEAFAAEGLEGPRRADVLSIVGLSLPGAMARLAPDASPAQRERMVEAYKAAFAARRLQETAPLYPGARAMIERLHGVDDILLGIATGKSRRGLDALLEAHDLRRYFVTTQVADDHPSKPHPAMALTALAEAGVAPERAVVIGDTTYDKHMARDAGVAFVGVAWGYHPALELGGALPVLQDFADLPGVLSGHWGRPV